MYVTTDLQENIKHGTEMFNVQVYDDKRMDPLLPLYTHWHQEVEFIKVLSHSFTLVINGVAHLAKAGDCYIINSSDLHEAYANDSKESLHFAVVFNLACLSSGTFDVCHYQYFDPILRGDLRFPTVISCHHPLNHIITNYLENTRQLFEQKPYGYELAVKANLTQILVTLFMNKAFEVVQSKQLDLQHSKLDVVKLAINHIHAHYKEKLLISSLAQEVNLSTEYFCRLFKQYTSKTPIEYLNHYRIEQAAKRLIETTDSITDICFDCGFENTSYFIRKFKAQKLTTPKQFRLTHQV